jgi:rhodanese-related sulfurtransferase
VNGIVRLRVDPFRWRGGPGACRGRAGCVALFLPFLSLLLPPPASAAPAWIALDAARQGHASGALLFVDFRPAAAYARAHIPGSLNVPPFALATRAFPTDRPVVLVGRGHCPPPAVGGGARALAGGLALWARQGGPVRGPAARQAAEPMLEPAAFDMARRGPDAQVLDTARTRHPRAETLLPEALHVPLEDSVRFEQILDALCRDAPPQRVVLLCDCAGEDAAGLAGAAAGVRDVPVFVLAGGVEALARLAAARAASPTLRRLGARPASRGAACGTCP